MAIYQFTIVLIPRLWAQENNYNPSSLYDKCGYFDTATTWNKYQPNVEFVKLLSTLFPQAKHLCGEVLYWGDDSKHDILVDYENELIKEICIRLDLSQNIDNILNKLVKVTNELDCVFFFPETKTIAKTDEIELKNAIKNSSAAKWVTNPYSFLENIKKQI